MNVLIDTSELHALTAEIERLRKQVTELQLGQNKVVDYYRARDITHQLRLELQGPYPTLSEYYGTMPLAELATRLALCDVANETIRVATGIPRSEIALAVHAARAARRLPTKALEAVVDRKLRELGYRGP